MKEKISQDINIVLITDNNYIIPTTVTIKSIINNTSKKNTYTISVLCDNVSAKNKKIFIDCAKGYSNVKVQPLDTSLNDLKDLHDSNNGNFMVATTTALLKFNIAEIFKNLDKILYLDGDLLVNCDVAEIFKTQLNDNYVAAVRDLPQVLFDKQDFGEDKDYFNSGVMLLNLKSLRKDKIRDLLIKTKKESINDKLMDQNVLNKVFRFKVVQLHFKYNMPYCLFSTLRSFDYSKLSAYYDVDIKCIEDLKQYDSIVHFSSYLKPWIFNDSPYAAEWYDVFANSPAKDLPLTRVSCIGQNLNSFKKLKTILNNKNNADTAGKTIIPKTPISPKYDISIIIPCFNQEENIETCLESAVNQTLKNIEIIVVNDCSTDNSLKILKKWQKKYSNIKIIDKKINEGTSNARKDGVLSSLGKCVMFLDSDDALEPNACETLFNSIEEKQVDILQFGVNVINHGVKQETFDWFNWFVRPFTGFLGGEEIFFACHESSKINYILWNKIYNGNLARKAFSYVQEGYFLMGEDLYAHAIMLYFAETYSGIEDKLYIYNYGAGLTGTGKMPIEKFKKLAPQMQIIELLYKFIDENEYTNYNRYIKAITKINENFFNNTCNNYSKTDAEDKDACFNHLLDIISPRINKQDYLNPEIYASVYNTYFKNIDTLYYAKFPRRMKVIYGNLKSYLTENCLLDDLNPAFEGRLYKEIFENKEFDKVDPSIIVPVVFASNMTYAPYIGVSIQSLIDNSSKDRFYDIYIFHSNIDSYTQELIRQISAPNIRVSFMNLANRVKNLGLYTHFHISVETYFRFFIPELIYRYDKVLYLDCDIAINDDIAKLYDIDMGNYPLAAAQNQLVKQTTIDYVKNTLKIKPEDYFNAGVQLINCIAFDKLCIKDKAIKELHKKKLMLMDQDALNLACKDNYLKLDGRWNFQVGCERYSVEYKYSADVGIYHYTSGNKPWNTKALALGEVFWKYARKTPFYEQIMLTLIEKSLNINSLKQIATPQVHASAQKPKTKKKSKITWPFRMIGKFFDCLKHKGFKFTMHCVKVKTKYVFNRMLGRVDKNNNPKKKNLLATQTVYYDYYKTLSPKKYKQELESWYNKKMNENMDIDNPKTFNQKIQWLKLYDSTLIKSHLTDKWLAKEYVKAVIGEDYIIKTLGVYDKFEDINFDKLPNQFVIKSTHGSGQIEIVKDKSKINKEQLKKRVNGWLKINYAYNLGLELHYANIIPRIIVEEYMSGINDDLYDYKIMCANGKVQIIWVDSNRFVHHERNVFSTKWEPYHHEVAFPENKNGIPKPKCLNELIKIAEKLSANFALVRCDLYILTDGTIKFGELTFTSGSGISDWKSHSFFDVMLGNAIVLPEKTEFKKLSKSKIKHQEKKFLASLNNNK